jgi:PAS domain S-box-containing protein/putative nucleotidyltransferase with HDIG domain
MATPNIYRTIVEQVPDGIYIISRGKFIYVNQAFERLTGIHRKGRPAPISDFLGTLSPAERAVFIKRREPVKIGKKPPARFRIRLTSKDGAARHLEFNTALISDMPDTVLGIVRDVTAAKAKDTARRLQERQFRAVIEAAEEPIAVIQNTIIRYVNPALTKMTGFTREELTGRPYHGYIAPGQLKIVEEYDIRQKTGKSTPFLLETVTRDKKGNTFNVQISIGRINYQGRPASLVIMQDITKYKRAEVELTAGLDKVRVALGATVQAISEIVEQRDPYTAGHQRRVADLGVAIASELGYSADRIEGIRMAGLLHDLGKISIPAEILTMPRKLTEVEFGIIKTHPKIAYDILRKIVFPWPIADIIYQHHERMNGSGYPQGLKDGAILAEARILAVADVVEAMITHRPYRQASRLQDALDEIDKNKGILYDSKAVEGCMKAFLSGAFSFKYPVFS